MADPSLVPPYALPNQDLNSTSLLPHSHLSTRPLGRPCHHGFRRPVHHLHLRPLHDVLHSPPSYVGLHRPGNLLPPSLLLVGRHMPVHGQRLSHLRSTDAHHLQLAG